MPLAHTVVLWHLLISGSHGSLFRDTDGQAAAACCSLPPPLGLADFEIALRQHQPSSHHAQQYRAADLARTQVRFYC